MDRLFSIFSQLNLRTLRLPALIRYSFSVLTVYCSYFIKKEFIASSEKGIFTTFFFAITLSAWFGGWWSGIFATIIAIFVVNYFFLTPFNVFQLTNSEDIYVLIIFVSQALLIITLISLMHRFMINVSENIAHLQESEQKFKQLYDSNLIGVAFWNVEGFITEANDECLSLLGYTQEDLQQSPINWIEITPPEYKKADAKALNQLRTKRVITPFLKEFYRKDGSRVYILISATMLQDSSYEGIAYMVDMTEEKYAEQQRDLFIGFVSHELKNPLSSIKAYTQLLKRQLIPTDKQKELGFIAKVEEKINLVTRLLNDMLDITKLRAGKLDFIDEEFNFNTMIKNIIEDMQKISPKHTIILQGEIHQKVQADKTRLTQVFNNLISNAIKYSPKANEVKISLLEESHNLIVTVEDFGMGIPKSEQGNIFEPLYRANQIRARAFPGTGLGLYIATEIIRHYKGTITLKSEEEKGSTFIVRLPLKVIKK